MSIVSHELKTPVTSLKVYTQLLQEQFEVINDLSSAHMLHKMDSQINKLSLLIKDLLDTARIDTGTLQVTYQLFDLNIVLNEVIRRIVAYQQYTPHHQKHQPAYYYNGRRGAHFAGRIQSHQQCY